MAAAAAYSLYGSAQPSPDHHLHHHHDDDGEDRSVPLLALPRFRIRLAQLVAVPVLCGVTYSASSDYLRRFDPGVSDLAAQRGVDVSNGRTRFFVFAVTVALAASMFNACAILAVRYSHPTKAPKHRVIAELAADVAAVLVLALGATLLLNPAAVGGDPADLVANSDLRNVACVLSAGGGGGPDFSALPRGTFVDYPAICRKLWCGVVFGYIALVTFLVSIVPGIGRARRVLG